MKEKLYVARENKRKEIRDEKFFINILKKHRKKNLNKHTNILISFEWEDEHGIG
jgi:hypothetical protein